LLRNYHGAQLWSGKLWFSDAVAVVYISRRLVRQRGKLSLFYLQPWVCEATNVSHKGVGFYIALWPYIVDRDIQAQNEQQNKPAMPDAYILSVRDNNIATVLLSTGEQFDTCIDSALLSNIDISELPCYIGPVMVDLENGMVSGYRQDGDSDAAENA